MEEKLEDVGDFPARVRGIHASFIYNRYPSLITPWKAWMNSAFLQLNSKHLKLGGSQLQVVQISLLRFDFLQTTAFGG